MAVPAEPRRAQSSARRLRKRGALGRCAGCALPHRARLPAVVPAPGGVERVDEVLRQSERRTDAPRSGGDLRAVRVDGLYRGAELAEVALAGVKPCAGTAPRVDEAALLLPLLITLAPERHP